MTPHRIAVLLLAGLQMLAGCSDVEKARIDAVLDARDAAVTARDIDGYSKLLLADYHDRGRTKITVVASMIDLFSQFDETRMQSFDRNIILIDENHAQCEQSYHLKVRIDNDWREITQREQLYLTKTPAGWRISGGL